MSSLGLALTTAFAHASGVLLWTDFGVADNWTPAVMATPYALTTATNSSDFETKVAAGGWDWVVLNISGSSQLGASSAMESWVASGGRAIVSNWYYPNTSLATSFGASYTGNTNYNSFTHSQTGIFSGVASPVNIVNPTYGIYSVGLAPLAGSTGLGLTSQGDSAVVMGNGGRTFMNGFLQDTAQDPASYQAIFKNELMSQPVPEPATLAAVGLAGAVAARRKRRR